MVFHRFPPIFFVIRLRHHQTDISESSYSQPKPGLNMDPFSAETKPGVSFAFISSTSFLLRPYPSSFGCSHPHRQPHFHHLTSTQSSFLAPSFRPSCRFSTTSSFSFSPPIHTFPTIYAGKLSKEREKKFREKLQWTRRNPVPRKLVTPHNLALERLMGANSAQHIYKVLYKRYMFMNPFDITSAILKAAKDTITPRSRTYTVNLRNPRHKKTMLFKRYILSKIEQVTSVHAAQLLYALALIPVDPGDTLWEAMMNVIEKDTRRLSDVHITQIAYAAATFDRKINYTQLERNKIIAERKAKVKDEQAQGQAQGQGQGQAQGQGQGQAQGQAQTQAQSHAQSHALDFQSDIPQVLADIQQSSSLTKDNADTDTEQHTAIHQRVDPTDPINQLPEQPNTNTDSALNNDDKPKLEKKKSQGFGISSRTVDEIVENENLKDLSVSQLKRILTKNNLKVDGNKDQLIQRLKDHYTAISSTTENQTSHEASQAYSKKEELEVVDRVASFTDSDSNQKNQDQKSVLQPESSDSNPISRPQHHIDDAIDQVVLPESDLPQDAESVLELADSFNQEDSTQQSESLFHSQSSTQKDKKLMFDTDLMSPEALRFPNYAKREQKIPFEFLGNGGILFPSNQVNLDNVMNSLRFLRYIVIIQEDMRRIRDMRYGSWLSCSGKKWQYQNCRFPQREFPPYLEKIRQRLYDATGVVFDGAFAEYFEHGLSGTTYRDTIDPWALSREWTPETVFVGFGNTRKLGFRDKRRPRDEKSQFEIFLKNGQAVWLSKEAWIKKFDYCLQREVIDIMCDQQITLTFRQSKSMASKQASMTEKEIRLEFSERARAMGGLPVDGKPIREGPFNADEDNVYQKKKEMNKYDLKQLNPKINYEEMEEGDFDPLDESVYDINEDDFDDEDDYNLNEDAQVSGFGFDEIDEDYGAESIFEEPEVYDDEQDSGDELAKFKNVELSERKMGGVFRDVFDEEEEEEAWMTNTEIRKGGLLDIDLDDDYSKKNNYEDDEDEEEIGLVDLEDALMEDDDFKPKSKGKQKPKSKDQKKFSTYSEDDFFRDER